MSLRPLSTDHTWDALYGVTVELMEAGKNDKQIEEVLVKRGVDPELARRIVQNVVGVRPRRMTGLLGPWLYQRRDQ